MTSLQAPAVRRRALAIAEAQQAVPRSPADRTADGEIALCLAAIVAKAGFLESGCDAEARRLEQELIATRSSARIEAAFSQLGWDTKDCRDKIAYNDSLDDRERKQRIIAFLSTHD